MSILPEYIIQQSLSKGMRAFRQDRKLIDALFRNLRQDDLDEIWKYFRDNTIDVSVNYPNQDLKLPSIVILLQSESEATAFVGNLMQDEISVRRSGSPFSSNTALRGDQTVRGSGSVGTLWDCGKLLLDPITITNASTMTVSIPNGLVTMIDPFEVPQIIRIIEGTGSGQERQVIGIQPYPNQDTIVTVTPAWTTLPDLTSVVQIGSEADQVGVTGEPSKIFSEGSIITRKGAHYMAVYQLLIAAPNQELTIYLYNIVKSIMFIFEGYLIKQGFLNLKISGTDFAPMPEYFPNLSYSRSMNLEFEYSFDVYTEITEALIETFAVSLAVHDPDVGNINNVEREVSLTEIDLSS